jgi:hypothetical protein
MTRFAFLRAAATAVAAACAAASGSARAGVINPDISVIGQPFMAITNDPASTDRERPRLDVGETEFVFDAYLNPYARGSFTCALSSEGFELEEGYFDLLRGLPLGLGLRGGQWRVGFGRLNPVHPHAYPFAERFNVLAAYLPGEEAFIETGASLSKRIPLHGEFSVNLSGDWLQGNSFRLARSSSGDPTDPLELGGDDGAEESRPAFAARLSGLTLLGEQSGFEFGLSATGGTNNVAADARTAVYGADVKAKLWTSPRSYLVLQAEALQLDRDDAAWDPALGYTKTRVTPAGTYVFADYNWAVRYDLGASWEGFQSPTPGEEWQQSVGAFAGLSLLEETTVFRADWRRILPDQADDFDQFTLRVIYSMGPHKAHQF